MNRPYHHGNLRVALIAAGVELAREDGPSAISIRDLARATGVSPSATYRHFPDVDHLVAEVSRTARQELARAMIEARERVAPIGDRALWALLRFDAIGRAYIHFALTESRIFETAFMLCGADAVEPEEPSAWDVLVAILDELVDEGALSPDRRSDAPIVAWGMVHGVASILVRRAFPDGTDDDFAISAAISAVERALGLSVPFGV